MLAGPAARAHRQDHHGHTWPAGRRERQRLHVGTFTGACRPVPPTHRADRAPHV